MLDEPLLIRADGSPEIGTGHVMRCLAIAQAWQAEGGSVYFLGEITGALESRLRDEGITLHALESTPGEKNDALEAARKAQTVGASWVVVDGYHFDGSYQHRLREEGVRVLFLEDYGHADYYEADLVLNQNIDAEEALYSNRSEDTDLLFGPRYAVLRKEFWPWRESRRTPQPEANRVLVTLGGADPDNCTELVVGAVGRLDREDLRCTVVIGGSNPNESSIAAAAERTDVSVDLRSNVNDMASLMAEHDIAVSAGGSTCWELAFMGIPNVILVLADNQRGIADGLDEEGTAVNLGWHESVGEEEIAHQVAQLIREDDQRHRMARKAQKLVDGWGTNRVVSRMRDRLFLRPVRETDCETLWHWANDPKVRERAYNSEPIPWEEHLKWFREKLEGDATIYIAEKSGRPVGQIRFDFEDSAGMVDVSVDSEERGCGYGTELIRRGTQRFLQDTGADNAVAYVKVSNHPSRRAFEKAGYNLEKKEEFEGEESFVLRMYLNS